MLDANNYFGMFIEHLNGVLLIAEKGSKFSLSAAKDAV